MKKKYLVNDQTVEIDLLHSSKDDVKFSFKGVVYEFQKSNFKNQKLKFEVTELSHDFQRVQTRKIGDLISPMPGKIFKILKNEGSAVKKGETILIMEAMKMELPIKAPTDGVVEKIFFHEGDLVQASKELIKLV